MPKGHGIDPEIASMNKRRGAIFRNRSPEILVKLAREQTVKAIETLVKILGDLEQPGAVRVRAAELLLERGWGKTPQQIILTDPEGQLGIAGIPILERIAAIKAAHSGGETIDLEASELKELPAAAAGKPGEDFI